MCIRDSHKVSLFILHVVGSITWHSLTAETGGVKPIKAKIITFFIPNSLTNNKIKSKGDINISILAHLLRANISGYMFPTTTASLKGLWN